MNKGLKIAVIGGDARQIFCAIELSRQGFETALYGFDNYKGDVGECTRCSLCDESKYSFDIFLLPLVSTTDSLYISTPLSKHSLALADFFSHISENSVVLYGKSETIRKKCKERKIQCYDYSERDDFQTLNAVPTAESAIAIAIENMPTTLCGQKALVLGYGRIGKVLTRLLVSFGAHVTASARKNSDFALIDSLGIQSVHTDKVADILCDFAVVFNTIPYPVLRGEMLSRVNKNCLIIDLASKPGGVDFESAKKEGLNVIWALSLPGKTSPVTAGEMLCKTVVNVLNERKELE